MIVLDTNVVSEAMRPMPNAAVVAWLDSQPDLYLCSPVLAEIYFGICRLGRSARKTQLMASYRQIVSNVFDGRALTFDTPSAEAYGEIVATRQAMGNPIAVMDAMIAGIAKSNGASLATCNTSHFVRTDVALVNPFDGTPLGLER
jgi:predicted nucleic acid-binding protein